MIRFEHTWEVSKFTIKFYLHHTQSQKQHRRFVVPWSINTISLIFKFSPTGHLRKFVRHEWTTTFFWSTFIRLQLDKNKCFSPVFFLSFFFQQSWPPAVWPDWATFWKFLVINFRGKVAQIFSDFLGYFENINFAEKTALATFWHIWKNFGYFLFQHLVTLIASRRRLGPKKSRYTQKIFCR